MARVEPRHTKAYSATPFSSTAPPAHQAGDRVRDFWFQFLVLAAAFAALDILANTAIAHWVSDERQDLVSYPTCTGRPSPSASPARY